MLMASDSEVAAEWKRYAEALQQHITLLNKALHILGEIAAETDCPAGVLSWCPHGYTTASACPYMYEKRAECWTVIAMQKACGQLSESASNPYNPFEGLSDVSIECDCGCGGRGRCYDGWPPDPDQPNEGDNDKAN